MRCDDRDAWTKSFYPVTSRPQILELVLNPQRCAHLTDLYSIHLRRTAYLRWVTIGELIASMGSSETLLASVPSDRRRHAPSRTGDSAIANSSTSPALRYWMITSAPPAIRISLSPASLRARKSARSIPSLTKL